jgi:hypothetical protein
MFRQRKPADSRLVSDAYVLALRAFFSAPEPVVVNLDIPVVEKPEEVHWVDNIHPAPKM